MRFGGFFHIQWNKDYGTDLTGKKCDAEMAGFGITDQLYEPYVNAKKSFGIRAAHDMPGTGIYSGKGQLATGAIVYGR